jgi:hypothetical protein
MQEKSYRSGEEYRRQPRQVQAGRQKRKGITPILWIVGVLVLIGLGFFGYIYVKHENANTNNPGVSTRSPGSVAPQSGCSGGSGCSNTSPTAGSPPQSGSGGPPINYHVGTITSVSTTSITIQPSGGGSPETFAITSHTVDQTTLNEPPTPYNARDFHDGEVVTVGTGGSDSRQAMLISPGVQSSSPPSHK